MIANLGLLTYMTLAQTRTVLTPLRRPSRPSFPTANPGLLFVLDRRGAVPGYQLAVLPHPVLERRSE